MNDRPMSYLLTPGPLTTSARTREAMLRDWGSRDPDFIALTARVRKRLCALANAEATHTAVLLQGSGTYALDATVQTLVPKDGKLLVLVNGAYGRRMVEIARRIGRDVAFLEFAEDAPADPDITAAYLKSDPAVTHVAVVHCETTSGILNPIEAIGDAVARAGRKYFIDAMSSFGAISIDARKLTFEAMMAASGKCLEGVPGMSFVLANKAALAAAGGNALSISLDLTAQWQGFEKDGQWRFTPPTQVLAALDCAMDQLDEEGGVDARGARYARNCRVLREGMARLGFRSILFDNLQAPIIVTFHRPPGLEYETFGAALKERGFVIYPGKLTKLDTFRIGCIGAIDAKVMSAAVDAVAQTMREMKISL